MDLFTIPGSLCEESYGEREIFDGMVCATSGTDALKSTCNVNWLIFLCCCGCILENCRETVVVRLLSMLIQIHFMLPL